MPSGRGPSGPWSRLKPVELDPLESMGLPSKGETRLSDFKVQNQYYTEIIKRYLTFCSDAGDRDSLNAQFAALSITSSPPTSSANKTTTTTTTTTKTNKPPHATAKAPAIPPDATKSKDLSVVLLALRKLREALVATKRADDFAAQAYLFSIRLSVLVRQPESYHPAILHLLRRIQGHHHHHHRNNNNNDTVPSASSSSSHSPPPPPRPHDPPLTAVEVAEVSSYLVLDAACRRGDLAGAYAARRAWRLRDARVDAVLRSLAHDNYAAFARLRAAADGHRARLMEFAEPTMRRHALLCLGRSYLSVDVAFLERAAGRSWEALRAEDGVGWERDGGRVVIRKVKARN